MGKIYEEANLNGDQKELLKKLNDKIEKYVTSRLLEDGIVYLYEVIDFLYDELGLKDRDYHDMRYSITDEERQAIYKRMENDQSIIQNYLKKWSLED